jgi:uncharacterized membrane protein YvbJ
MFWLKSCPKCNGDLNDHHDNYGNYVSCFQCGHYLTSDEEYDVKRQISIIPDRVLPKSRTARKLTQVSA